MPEPDKIADPLIFLMQVLANDDAPFPDRLAAAKAAAPYIHARQPAQKQPQTSKQPRITIQIQLTPPV